MAERKGSGEGAEVERRRREDRGAEGGGVSPLPRIFFRFGAQNGEFWCILGGILKNAANSVSMALAC